ncbi:MAG: hypothetical protein K8W52_31745 [Deltaproteobacteria bacterium]|nr:hypothetical protein [Deltaproteobacteria bacterium]
MARLDAQTFLANFVRPLVMGGPLHVGRPIRIEEVELLEQGLDHASVELVAIVQARTDVVSTLVCRPPPFVLDGDDLALAAALHNALFLVHPDADGLLVAERHRRRVIDSAQALAARPLTRSKTRALARHGLLHNVFGLSRTDLLVSWWTGSARFLGQPVPTRLTRWKGVRRVREDHSKVEYDELVAAPDLAPVIATLLRRSPITQLVTAHRNAPSLHWEDAVWLLRDPELARAAAYAAIRPGDARDQVLAPARLAAAFEQMLERAPLEADVRTVAGFLTYVNALYAMAEAGARRNERPIRGAPAAVDDGKSALLTAVLASERAGQRPRGLATFFALPNALAMVDERLAKPPGLDQEPAIARRWKAHRAQVAEAVGEPVIEALAERLRRHLRVPHSFEREAPQIPA